jgi:hypothetical protein
VCRVMVSRPLRPETKEARMRQQLGDLRHRGQSADVVPAGVSACGRPVGVQEHNSAAVERDGNPREAARSSYAMSVGCRAARTDDHRQVCTGALCGPSQRMKRRAITRRDTDQRRVFPLVAQSSGCDQEACLVSWKMSGVSRFGVFPRSNATSSYPARPNEYPHRQQQPRRHLVAPRGLRLLGSTPPAVRSPPRLRALLRSWSTARGTGAAQTVRSEAASPSPMDQHSPGTLGKHTS